MPRSRNMTTQNLAMTLALVAGAAAITPARARAQQPVGEFLRAASTRALDTREAAAALRQAQSQVDEARARLLPSFTAIGTYQRNEREAVFQARDLTGMPVGDPIVIQPFDALTAQFSVTVPLIDVAAWSVYFQTEAYAEASEGRLEATSQNVAVSVVSIWYQLVAARATTDAAERNVAALEQNRTNAAARVEVGVAAQLELSRAESEVARARQVLAEARLQAVLAARNLQNLTGLTPTDARVEIGDLEAELRPLDHYLANAADLPAIRAARESARAAAIASDTAWTELLPVISAFARENGSNAGGFQGANWSYALGVQAVWALDFARPARISTRAAEAEIADVQLERTIQQIETGIFESYERVGAERARADAALASVVSSRRAAEDAQVRFDAGAATQLDVIQADRDLFQAEVSLIQTLADLHVAYSALLIQSGMDL